MDLRIGNRSGIKDFAAVSLRVAESMGYSKGSPVYNTILDAWISKDVPFIYPLTDPMFNTACQTDDLSGLFIGDGNYSIGVNEYTDAANADSGRSRCLLACADNGLPAVNTLFRDKDGEVYRFDDGDNDGIFTLDNNLQFSKPAISVHGNSQYALKVILEKFNYAGLDNLGEAGDSIVSVLDAPDAPWHDPYYDPVSNTFNYSLNKQTSPQVSLDIVAGEIVKAIPYRMSGKPTLPGAEAYCAAQSVADLLGTYIQAIHKRETINLNEELDYFVDWKIGEQVDGIGYRNLASPKSLHHPNFYKGQYYDPQDDPKINAGVLNFALYLIANGGDGYRDDQSALGYFNTFGIGIEKASALAFELHKEIGSGQITDLEAVGVALPNIAIQLFGYASTAHITVVDACYAVGLSDKSSNDIRRVTPEDKTAGTNPWDYDNMFGIEEFNTDMAAQIEIHVWNPSKPNSLVVYALPYESSTIVGLNDNLPAYKAYVAGMALWPNTFLNWKIQYTGYDHGKATIQCGKDGEGNDLCDQFLQKWNGHMPTLSFTTGPAKVVYKEPSDAATDVNPWYPKFGWIKLPEKLSGDVKYILRIALNPDMTNQVLPDREYTLEDLTNEQPSKDINQDLSVLEIGKKYYWAMTATGVTPAGHNAGTLPDPLNNGTMSSDWNDADVWSFTTEKPKSWAISPRNQEKKPAFGIPFDLTWNYVKGAKEYDIVLHWAANGNLNNTKTITVPVPTGYSGNQLSLEVNNEDLPLPYIYPGVVYYWEPIPKGFKTYNNATEQGECTQMGSFMLDASQVPKVTGLATLDPARGISTSCFFQYDIQLGDQPINFTWNKMLGADHYKIKIWDVSFDDDFNIETNVLYESDVPKTGHPTEFATIHTVAYNIPSTHVDMNNEGSGPITSLPKERIAFGGGGEIRWEVVAVKGIVESPKSDFSFYNLKPVAHVKIVENPGTYDYDVQWNVSINGFVKSYNFRFALNVNGEWVDVPENASFFSKANTAEQWALADYQPGFLELAQSTKGWDPGEWKITAIYNSFECGNSVSMAETTFEIRADDRKNDPPTPTGGTACDVPIIRYHANETLVDGLATTSVYHVWYQIDNGPVIWALDGQGYLFEAVSSYFDNDPFSSVLTRQFVLPVLGKGQTISLGIELTSVDIEWQDEWTFDPGKRPGIDLYWLDPNTQQETFINSIIWDSNSWNRAYDNTEFPTLGGWRYYPIQDNRLALIDNLFKCTDGGGKGAREASESVITENLNSDTALSIYPNPVQKALYLHAPEAFSEGVITVQNMGGQVVYQGAFRESLDASNWPAGVYILTIKTNATLNQYKLVKL